MYFNDVYKHRKVLVFGHTGFKGSWLVAWLRELGADVVGVSNCVPTQPAHIEVTGLDRAVKGHTLDIRDLAAVSRVIEMEQPDWVFHLAAQSLVKYSYDEPIETFTTNAIGTAHILEALRRQGRPCIGIIITSDKCYDNVEWIWGYRETDRLGGKDPYSASKGAAELVIRSYVESYFSAKNCPIRLGIGRAGNVIGGGDWAADRVVPDCIRAWSESDNVSIRNPNATRPWQHVLEPLSGYLALGAQLHADATLQGEAFNFGPSADMSHSVRDLVEQMSRDWPGVTWQDTSDPHHPHTEAGLLKLNCDKALAKLGWRGVLTFPETVSMTTSWYRDYYSKGAGKILALTTDQIHHFCDLASARGIAWATRLDG